MVVVGDSESPSRTAPTIWMNRRRTVPRGWTDLTFMGFPVASVVALEIAIAIALRTRTAAGPLSYLMYLGLVVTALVIPVFEGRSAIRQVLRFVTLRARVSRRAVETPSDLLLALYPDLVIRNGETRSGKTIGVATVNGLAVVAVEVSTTSLRMIHEGVHRTFPIHQILGRLDGMDVSLHSMALIRISQGAQRRPSFSIIDDAAVSDSSIPVPGKMVFALRIDPYRSLSAIQSRGGGHQGLIAVFDTLTRVVQAELRSNSLSSNILDANGLVRNLRHSLFEQQELGVLCEDWAVLSSGDLHHGTMQVTHWPKGANMNPILRWPGLGLVSSVELFPDASADINHLTTKAWLRVTRNDPEDVRQEMKTLTRGTGRLFGARSASRVVRLSVVHGGQMEGLRATTILGADHASSI